MAAHSLTLVPDSTPAREPMVDAKAAGAHLGFSAAMMRKLAAAGKVPGHPYGMGKQVHWRFRLSELDAAAPTHIPSSDDE